MNNDVRENSYIHKKEVSIRGKNFVYEGDVVDNEAHGHGVFHYNDGAIYIGNCKYGSAYGFGIYHYADSAKYIGFFSAGARHGKGTYETDLIIYKGDWLFDKKHGMFRKTNKKLAISYLEKWLDDKLVKSRQIQYVPPYALQTLKENPLQRMSPYQIPYQESDKKCVACCEKPINAVNTKCGHMVLCSGCWQSCNKCPICRAPIEKILLLYIS